MVIKQPSSQLQRIHGDASTIALRYCITGDFPLPCLITLEAFYTFLENLFWDDQMVKDLFNKYPLIIYHLP